MSPFSDRTVLVLDDDAIIALHVQDILLEAGVARVLMASDLETALALIANHSLDLAFLDVNLGGARSDAAAAALEKRGVPFVFVTGYGEQDVSPTYAAAPCLEKPFEPQDILMLARTLLAPSAG